jgi:hypothetical protein
MNRNRVLWGLCHGGPELTLLSLPQRAAPRVFSADDVKRGPQREATTIEQVADNTLTWKRNQYSWGLLQGLQR